MYTKKAILNGQSEIEAQIKAIHKLSQNHKIDFWEVWQMEDFLDDRVIIPDYIQRMSNEELDAEIARLEAEAVARKAQFYKEQERKIIGPQE